MGAPVSVALDPRTRPSVPASIHQFCTCQSIQRSQLTVHSNTPDDVLTQMLLRPISDVTDNSTSSVLTATSKVSLLPPLSVVKALRMEGSCSVSNLTSTTCDPISAPRSRDECRNREKFSTASRRPYSSDDLMNLSILRRVCGGEARAQGGQEVLLDGLESANGGRAAEVGACAQNPAKIIILATLSSSIGMARSQTHLFSIL
jgi:hypothetical protein